MLLNIRTLVTLETFPCCSSKFSFVYLNIAISLFCFPMNDTVYELWFKQMLYEIDSVRSLLSQVPFDERKQLVINQRMGRVVGIAKVSCNYNYFNKNNFEAELQRTQL